MKYILEGKTAKPCTDILEWAKWFEQADRSVICHDLPGGVYVSTVFLGVDHQFGPGPPLLFETMIFRGKHDQYQERYSTWEEAMDGHKRALALVLNRRTEP